MVIRQLYLRLNTKKIHRKGIPSILAHTAHVTKVSNRKFCDHSNLRIWITAKQMLERLPIAAAEVKAGNKSEKLLNGIMQITCNKVIRENGYYFYEFWK